MRTTLIRLIALLAIVALAGACSSDSGSSVASGDGETSSETTPPEPVGGSSAEEYATGTCTAINDWITSIQDRATGLSDVPPDATAGQDVMLDFLDGVISDTDALIGEVEALGVPDVPEGEAASEALLGVLGQVRDLYQGIRDSVADLDTSDPTAFASALGELSTGLDSGSTDIGSALEEFQDGELAGAFQADPACAQLTTA
jgi:hypothetical protein